MFDLDMGPNGAALAKGSSTFLSLITMVIYYKVMKVLPDNSGIVDQEGKTRIVLDERTEAEMNEAEVSFKKFAFKILTHGGSQ
mmetsp:Transcript_31615/g.28761  ORF Transcript_31615/g.28761 Transcript_31615/m.28761 type:complete len:83 (+) Transcript_31615:606-854(+)